MVSEDKTKSQDQDHLCTRPWPRPITQTSQSRLLHLWQRNNANNTYTRINTFQTLRVKLQYSLLSPPFICLIPGDPLKFLDETYLAKTTWWKLNDRKVVYCSHCARHRTMLLCWLKASSAVVGLRCRAQCEHRLTLTVLTDPHPCDRCAGDSICLLGL